MISIFSLLASPGTWNITPLWSPLTGASVLRGLQVEADSYWCLCKLLDGIQDHYTYAQPGIQRTVFHLKELVRRAGLGSRAFLGNYGTLP